MLNSKKISKILIIPVLLVLSCNSLNERINDMKINYKVLPDEEYEMVLEDACEFVQVNNDDAKDAMRIKVGELQENIVKLLELKWKEKDNWSVTYDYNYQYYTCGAVYSKELFSREYIEQVIKAINLMDEPEKWAYHTVGELNPLGKTEIMGEFFIKNRTVYIPQSMPKKYRQMLGCEK